MARFESIYPFAAVCGQANVKQALLIAAVNPAVGGVLLSGEKGTAKSTLARGLAALVPGAPFVELPLNVTEDRLVGSIDIASAIRAGTRKLCPGLLLDADGGFLYADEINLLPEHIASILLAVSALGENTIEREGVSLRHPSRFVLLGSMNPEEGDLRSHLSDRFGLYVRVSGERDATLRCEITRRRLEYETDPTAFVLRWRDETQNLQKKLSAARKDLAGVRLHEAQVRFAANLAKEGRCAGHRAELTVCEAARAIAALDKRTDVTDDDVRHAAFFALPHRLREAIAIEEAQPETEQSEQQKSEEADEPEIELAPPDGEATEPFAPDLPPNDAACAAADDERWQDIEPVACPPKVQLVPAGQTHPQGAGKRLKTQSHTKKGRYARYRMPNGKTSDIALDATIRAAVMHPSPPGGLAVQVRQEDVREKVREHRTGASILFLVDASGSMGARRRMGAVKGAVVSMLKDAYQKRDTVGIVSFRKDRADCVLGLTRSVDLAEKKLRDLKTGGKTPLALGLMKAYALLKTERIKNPDALQYLVVVSDGRANISPNGGDAFEEALQIAKRLRTEHVQSLLLDTENGYIRLGFGKKLADALGGEYLLLQTITGGEIKASVSDFLKH